MTTAKAFCYVVRLDAEPPLLLAFESLDEPGFEVPKGSVEPGETLVQGALRELQEEAGITCQDLLDELGVTWYLDEEQHFFLLAAPAGFPDRFAHTVTSTDMDDGFVYQFRWLELGPALREQLVQGCDRFVDALLQRFPGQAAP